MGFLYHYTKIDTLAMILKSNSIRFNSLSNVDDLDEKVVDKLNNVGNSVLVSCWTKDYSESIPLWSMYSSDFCGCRIRLDEDMFKYRNKDLGDCYPVEFHNDNMFIIPHDFLRDIKYVDELSKREITGDSGEYIVGKLGREKLRVWEFQKECRFCIYQVHDKSVINRLEKQEFQYADNNVGLNNSFIDLEIIDTVKDNIVVTLGPKCNEGHKVIIELLLNNYTLNGKIEYSKLTGKL